MDIFSCMAQIIRLLINNKFDAAMAKCISETDLDEISHRIEKMLNECKENSWQSVYDAISREQYDEALYLALLQKLDKNAESLLKKLLWSNLRISENIKCMGALNKNMEETQIMLIPRYDCIWNGKSREANHIMDINTYLQNFYYVEMLEGKLAGKYYIKNYILNPALYGVTLEKSNKLFVQIAVSPLARGIRLSMEKCEKDKEKHKYKFFSVNELSDDYQAQLLENIVQIIREADKRGDNILVFPEMLGTIKMKCELSEQLESMELKNIFFIVFPSIWLKKEDGNHRNTSYILGSDGEEWFAQDKLKAFIYKDEDTKKEYLEDIIEGDTIYVLHCEGYGSIAVAICRSELEEDIKDILIKRLNVKLILCPSWTQGHHEFERSILIGAERNCNVAWCNACSAVEKKKFSAEEFDKKIVGIITSFGKNHDYSRIDFDECTFPVGACDGKCDKGCSFSNKIYGIDYKKEWDEYE